MVTTKTKFVVYGNKRTGETLWLSRSRNESFTPFKNQRLKFDCPKLASDWADKLNQKHTSIITDWSDFGWAATK